MDDKQNGKTFQYTYSAKEQEEIRRIRNKYMPREEDKMALLRRLDAQAAQKAGAYAIAVGVIGALILGTGMSCCMVWGGALFIPGIIIGTAGIAAIAAAYPVYSRIAGRERARVAPEILRLTDELMK